MKYKGYHGQVTYDEEAKLFHGEVSGLRDVITFQGTTVNELKQGFKDSIDEYLDFCKELGRGALKSHSREILYYGSRQKSMKENRTSSGINESMKSGTGTHAGTGTILLYYGSFLCTNKYHG